MADRFTLDACDWPLVINDGDVVVATLPLPNGSAGDDAAGLAQIERANAIVRFLNGDESALLACVRLIYENHHLAVAASRIASPIDSGRETLYSLVGRLIAQAEVNRG